MRWNSEERAFAVEAYFSSGCSVIATQRAFRNRFNLAPLAPVPDRKSIVTWVTTFRQTASATKRRTGVPRSVRSPENMHYKQNMRYWADTNPRELHQRPLHSPKVTVVCNFLSWNYWSLVF
uniref:DUF4817 domain-containing protein n=1 Tax=Homalodisca liturata TaxID=320908 RepID=A0A1B6HQS9_9HEMI